MYVRDEEMFVKTGQLEAAAISINSIFQKEDHDEYKTSLKDSIETAQKLLNDIRRIAFDDEREKEENKKRERELKLLEELKKKYEE